jgi:hypothetical protein
MGIIFQKNGRLMIEPGHICQLVLSLAENKFVNDLILNFVRY